MSNSDSHLSHLPKVLANEVGEAIRDAKKQFGDDFVQPLNEWRRQRMDFVALNGLTVGHFVGKEVVYPTPTKKFKYEELQVLEALDKAFTKLHEYYDDPTIYASQAVIAESLAIADVADIKKLFDAEIIEKIKKEARSSTSKKAGDTRAANNEASKALDKIETEYKKLAEKNGGKFKHGRLSEFYKNMYKKYYLNTDGSPKAGINGGSDTIKKRIEKLRKTLGHT